VTEAVEIYTDGGVSRQSGSGRLAALLLFGEHERELSGAEAATTTTAWN